MFCVLANITNDEEVAIAKKTLTKLYKNRSILEKTALNDVVKCMIDKEISMIDEKVDQIQAQIEAYILKTQKLA